jgi:hypothetical protein
MGTVIISRAQYVYTIKADSVKLTNSCDSTELILLNHTQGVNGFLYNPGTGRTYFQRGLLKLSDSTYLIGADTLKVIPFGNAVLLNPSSPQNGNVSIIGTMSVQGMIDATNNINISNGGFLYGLPMGPQHRHLKCIPAVLPHILLIMEVCSPPGPWSIRVTWTALY